MTFTGNALADMNLLEESPGCYGFSWRFTGLKRTQVKVHRAVLDLCGISCFGFSSNITTNSSTVTNSIAFPWLRGVPEGISSGTWGQTDPAGSLLASDSAHLPNFSHTTSHPHSKITCYMQEHIPDY